MSAPAGKRSPLARRFGSMLFVAGVLCIAVTAGVFYVLWSQQTASTRISELERQVGVIAAGVSVSDVVPGSAGDVGGSRARLLKVEAGLTGTRLAVTDANGHVLYSTAGSSSLPSYPINDLSRPASELAARTGVIEVPAVGRIVVAAVPVAFQGGGTPVRYLVGVRALSELGAADRWILLASGAAILVGLLAAWLLGALLTRRVTAPLLRLTEGARAVTAGEWGRQVAVEGDDEVSELARAFNQMSTRVADVYQAQREFVGDVSHELRTPITSIRGFAEAISDGTVADVPGARRAAGIIASEASALAELTSTLLVLSDLDSGAVAVDASPVDTARVGALLVERFAPMAAGTGVRLEVELAGSPRADAERLLQVLTTLVDNAMKHAKTAGHVRVRSRVQSGVWRVEVDDDGPGVPAADRERIFGRFTRLDASRAESGSGLGLAIARRLATLMGGVVRAEDSPDLGGARFVIELPASAGAASDSTVTQRPSNPPATDTDDSGRRGPEGDGQTRQHREDAS